MTNLVDLFDLPPAPPPLSPRPIGVVYADPARERARRDEIAASLTGAAASAPTPAWKAYFEHQAAKYAAPIGGEGA